MISLTISATFWVQFRSNFLSIFKVFVIIKWCSNWQSVSWLQFRKTGSYNYFLAPQRGLKISLWTSLTSLQTSLSHYLMHQSHLLHFIHKIKCKTNEIKLGFVNIPWPKNCPKWSKIKLSLFRHFACLVSQITREIFQLFQFWPLENSLDFHQKLQKAVSKNQVWQENIFASCKHLEHHKQKMHKERRDPRLNTCSKALL